MNCSCGNPVEGTTKKCGTCNRDDRRREEFEIKKARKRIAKMSKPSKPSKRIKPISDKRAKEMGEYQKVKDKYLEEHPICECCGTQKSDQIHHKAGRHNKRLIDFTKFLATCDPCHKEIEANPEWAISNGYSELRT